MADTKQKPIRLGMVGGGQGAFIGDVHRMAARIDGCYQLVAGALSSTPEKAQASGLELGLEPERIYDDFEKMAQIEAGRVDGIEAVSIVTPNHMHYPAAKAFLAQGIHVICDKPLTSTLEDAEKLADIAEKSSAIFVLTHNYTGYPMIRQAREMVQNGDLGKIRLVQVEYIQDWLTVEQDSKQAEWRTDPKRSGVGGATGDIGTHAFNLAQFVSSLKATRLAADLQSFVPGRKVDDNAHVLLHFEGEARGTLWCSQVAPGNENSLKLRVYGDKGGLEWSQEDPNYLWFTPFSMPKQLITRNGAGAGNAAARMSRVPAGHPEGYLEGFANIYMEAALAIRAHQNGAELGKDVVYPSCSDGVEGVRFIEACVQSSKRNTAWIDL